MITPAERNGLSGIDPRTNLVAVLEIPNIRTVLDEAVFRQLDLMTSGRFDRFRGLEDEAFLSAFSLDPLLVKVHNQTRDLIRHGSDEIEKRFRGALFEVISYAYLSSADQSRVLIMGAPVKKVLGMLYPNAKVRDRGLGQSGLDGVSVPDGFFVGGNGKIVAIVECTLAFWENKERKDNQTLGYAKLAQKLGDVAEDPSLEIISPTFDDLWDVTVFDGSIKVVPNDIPIAETVLRRRFFPYAYSGYRGKDGKTLAELAAERKVKRLRVMGEPALFPEPSK